MCVGRHIVTHACPCVCECVVHACMPAAGVFFFKLLEIENKVTCYKVQFLASLQEFQNLRSWINEKDKSLTKRNSLITPCLITCCPFQLDVVRKHIFSLYFFPQHHYQFSDLKDETTTRWEQWILASQLTFQNSVALVQNPQVVVSCSKTDIRMW